MAFLAADDVAAFDATTETVTIESRSISSVGEGPKSKERAKGGGVMVGSGSWGGIVAARRENQTVAHRITSVGGSKKTRGIGYGSPAVLSFPSRTNALINLNKGWASGPGNKGWSRRSCARNDTQTHEEKSSRTVRKESYLGA